MDNSTYGLILDSIADAVKAGKKEVALGAIESLRGFLFSMGKPEVSVKARKPKASGFDIYRCVSNDETRRFMMGIYHDSEAGLAVATNGQIMIQIRSDYDPEHAGEIIMRDGRKIDGQFPAWRRVTPEKKDMEEKDVDWASVRSTLDGAKPCIAALKRCKVKKEHREPSILIHGVRLSYEYAGMACDFKDVYPDARFYVHTEGDRCYGASTNRSVVLLSGTWKNPEALFIIMPMTARDESDKDNYVDKIGLTWRLPGLDSSDLIRHLHHKDWHERKKQGLPSKQDKKDEDTIKMVADFFNIKIEED